MGAFDDLVPAQATASPFEDLVPKGAGVFDDLVPQVPKFEPERQLAPPTEQDTEEAMEQAHPFTTPLMKVLPRIAPRTMERLLTLPAALARQRIEETPDEVTAEAPDGVAPNQPILERVAEMVPSPKTAAMATGAEWAASDMANFFTSPLGISTLGMGALPAAVQRVVALTFAGQMAKEVPGIARELGTELGKPEEERDYTKIAHLTATAAANTGFAAAGFMHGAARPMAERLGAYPEAAAKAEVWKSKLNQPISEFGGDSEVLPEPGNEQQSTTGAVNVIESGNEQAGVQPEREGGDAGGQAAEASGGDRVLAATEGQPGDEGALSESPAGETPGRADVAGAEPEPEPEGAAVNGPSPQEETPAAAAAEPVTAEPDAVESWLNQAIAATNVGGGQVMEGITGAPVWLAKGAANAGLRVAKVVYTTTRDLGQAIAAAVEHVRGLNLPGFNADELKRWVSGLAERQTGAKLAASASVSDQTKQAITEYLYERRTNASDDEIAAGVLQRTGLEGATEILRNAPGTMPAAVWSRLLRLTTRMLGDQERIARGKGDTAGAEALAKRSGELWDEMLPKITEQAQGLQALNDLVELSPDAQVARTRRRLERAADEEVGRHADETTQMQTAIEEGRQAGIEAVKQDGAVNGATRAAVDEAVAQSDEVRRAVIMDMAGPWSESPAIVAMAREQVRAKANELLNKQPMPKGLSAAQELRRTMDDLAKRAATIAAGYFQGAAAHADGLKGLLMERLGLDEAHAGRLAKGLDGEFQRQVKLGITKLPARIRAVRAQRQAQLDAERRALAAASKTVREAAARGATAESKARVAEADKKTQAERKAWGEKMEAAGGLPKDIRSATSGVDAAIRRQLKLLNQRMGEVLQQEAGRRDVTGAHVAERVVQASGLKGQLADTMRDTLTNRWNTIVTNAQIKALEALQKRTGVKVTPKYRTAFDKLVELDRLGALTSERFYDVVKESLKLKRLTAGDAQVLRRLVARAQELPEGFLRQRASAEVLKLTEKLTGNVKWWRDVPMAVFYSNILSGVTTLAKIPFENANLLIGQTLTQFLGRPREWLHSYDFAKSMAGAYKRGIAKGVLQGADTLRSGIVSGVWEKPKVPVLEMKFHPAFNAINYWKYFGRVIGTTHELTFKPAWEVKQTVLAREVARREGLSGSALQQRVADLMANTEEKLAAARAQALSELPNGGRLDIARRTREIIEQQREVNMPGSTEEARYFALKTAYLNEPEGFLGYLATKAREFLEGGRRQNPIIGTAIKTQAPFTTIVANILNEKLNWTPVGLLRAIHATRTGELYGRKLSGGEVGALYAKSILGTLAMALAAELADHIHGNGPSDPRKRKQLQAAGWIPHSIELGGRYYSYMNIPAALGLAVIGNTKDWSRYGHGEEADGVQRAAFVTKAIINAIISQGMLDSLKRIFEAVGSESTSEGGDRLQKLAARTGSSFVFPNLVQQADRMFDPTQYDQTGVGALLQSQVPFARRNNRPVLNVLGEPVQQGPFHYWASKQSADAVWRLIADKEAFISAPNKSQVLTWDGRQQRMRAVTDDEYYKIVKESGPQIRKFIEDNLEELQKMDPEMVKQELRKVVNAYHTTARFQVGP